MTAYGVLARLHRYAGLTIAAFLVVAGLTGSVIAFHRELDAWLNPSLYDATAGTALSPGTLAARVEDADPRVHAAFIEMNVPPGSSALIWIEPRADAPDVRYDQVFVDPVTGHILGRRLYGQCCFRRAQIIPFLYVFHRRLAMPGHWGDWLMGGVAILWTIDCFVALVLTVPRRRPLLARWQPAWRVKRGASAFRTTFDLHRAGGLWLWAVLLALAMSSVYLNLGREIFRPLVGLVSPLTPTPYERAPAAPRDLETARSFEDIAAAAAALGSARGWRHPPSGIYRDRQAGLYVVDFGANAAAFGMPWAAYDAATGAVVATQFPGEGTAGDVFLDLQFPLHSGRIAGLPGRILICLAGIAVAVLSVTGVVIWRRKRAARQRRLRHAGGVLR